MMMTSLDPDAAGDGVGAAGFFGFRLDGEAGGSGVVVATAAAGGGGAGAGAGVSAGAGFFTGAITAGSVFEGAAGDDGERTMRRATT